MQKQKKNTKSKKLADKKLAYSKKSLRGIISPRIKFWRSLYRFKILLRTRYAHLSYYKKHKLAKKYVSWLRRRRKHVSRRLWLRRNKAKAFFHVFKIKRLFFPFNYKKYIKIRVTQNNIFAAERNTETSKTINTRSAGQYGIGISRRKLAFGLPLFLKKYTKNLPRKSKGSRLAVVVEAPKRSRRKIARFFFRRTKAFRLMLCLNSAKCFNGCRAKKLRRKKFKKKRILKL